MKLTYISVHFIIFISVIIIVTDHQILCKLKYIFKNPTAELLRYSLIHSN